MKKQYTSPEIEVVEAYMNSIIALSMMSDTEAANPTLEVLTREEVEEIEWEF